MDEMAENTVRMAKDAELVKNEKVHEPIPGTSRGAKPFNCAKRKILLSQIFDSSCESLFDSEPESRSQSRAKRFSKTTKDEKSSSAGKAKKSSNLTEKDKKSSKLAENERKSSSNGKEGKFSPRSDEKRRKHSRSDETSCDEEEIKSLRRDEKKKSFTRKGGKSSNGKKGKKSSSNKKEVLLEPDKPTVLAKDLEKAEDSDSDGFDSMINDWKAELDARDARERELASKPTLCIPSIMKRPSSSKSTQPSLRRSASDPNKVFSFGLSDKPRSETVTSSSSRPASLKKGKSEPKVFSFGLSASEMAAASAKSKPVKKGGVSKAKRFSFGLSDKSETASTKTTSTAKSRSSRTAKAKKAFSFGLSDDSEAEVATKKKPRKTTRAKKSSTEPAKEGGRSGADKTKPKKQKSLMEMTGEELLAGVPNLDVPKPDPAREAEYARMRSEWVRLEKVIQDYEEEKKQQEKYDRLFEKWEQHNVVLRDRLADELKEEDIRRMVRDNFEYLEKIWDGTIQSDRHDKYKIGGGIRLQLLHTMITDPFTDEQLQWTVDEMTKRWMPNYDLIRQHDDYVWKVLIPECFTKMYQEYFNIPTKHEALIRIRNTPIRPGPDGLC